MATDSAVEQSLPRLPAAPSPMAGTQGTCASWGHRAAHSGERPDSGWSTSVSGPSFSSEIPDAASISGSHSHLFWSNKPVADAMETEQADLRNSFWKRYSPGDIQRETRRNS